MSKLQELRRDRARLDWLISAGSLHKFGLTDDVWIAAGDLEKPGQCARISVRAAIDAAMAKGEKK